LHIGYALVVCIQKTVCTVLLKKRANAQRFRTAFRLEMRFSLALPAKPNFKFGFLKLDKQEQAMSGKKKNPELIPVLLQFFIHYYDF
jgi:hypothetical protein